MSDDRRKVWDPAAFPERRDGGGGRRAHPRVPVRLTVTGSGEHASDEVLATDLSVGGAALLLPERILAGARAKLELDVPGSDTPAVVIGEVVGDPEETPDGWETRIRFQDVGRSDAKLIEGYLDGLRKRAGG